MRLRRPVVRLRPGEHLLRIVPVLSVLAAIIAMAAPIPMAWGVLPQLPLLFVMVWARLAPRLMPPPVVLMLGILTDLVVATPLGVHAALLTAAAIAVRLTEVRTETHSLFLDWIFATLIIFVANLLGWQMLGFTGLEAPLLPIMVQAGLTILTWPIVVRIAARIQRQIMDS